jgi:hypothetical protein
MVEAMIYIEDCRLPQEEAFSILGDSIVLSIDPSKITKLIKKECLVGNDWLPQKPFFEYFVVGGDWDKNYGEVKSDRNYQEICDLIKYGHAFRKSDTYAMCVDELKNGFPQKGVHGFPFKTEADIDETFNYYLNLIQTMKAYGYRPILETSKPTPERHIGVSIAPSGEFFHFRTGHHRLAIANQIGLKSVLVHVHFVHSKWAENATNAYKFDEMTSIKFALNTLKE